MEDLDPTQYGEADAGGRRGTGRLLVREKHCRSWLSKIICGVIFYETLCKADAPAPARAVDSRPRRPYVELSFAHREHGSRFVIWYCVDDPEPGK
jgi:hypothetical protein